MNTYVVTKNIIEGFHYYKDAKNPVLYLRNEHRHQFYVYCYFEVTHDDRQIEIFTQQDLIKKAFDKSFGTPASFENMSCEMIAKFVLQNFENCYMCKVLEDDQGGAIVTK